MWTAELDSATGFRRSAWNFIAGDASGDWPCC